MDFFEGKSAEQIITEMGRARAKLQPDGDIVVPALVIKKVIVFTESELDIDTGCQLYLGGYLDAVKNNTVQIG